MGWRTMGQAAAVMLGIALIGFFAGALLVQMWP